jgi:hypothetical protein
MIKEKEETNIQEKELNELTPVQDNLLNFEYFEKENIYRPHISETPELQSNIELPNKENVSNIESIEDHLKSIEDEVKNIFEFLQVSDTIKKDKIYKDIHISEEKNLDEALNEIRSDYLNLSKTNLEDVNEEQEFLLYDNLNRKETKSDHLPGEIIHKVHPHDTIVSIALNYGVTGIEIN